jgi:hypothetical protein
MSNVSPRGRLAADQPWAFGQPLFHINVIDLTQMAEAPRAPAGGFEK